jgi:hypothetical protein
MGIGMGGGGGVVDSIDVGAAVRAMFGTGGESEGVRVLNTVREMLIMSSKNQSRDCPLIPSLKLNQSKPKCLQPIVTHSLRLC